MIDDILCLLMVIFTSTSTSSYVENQNNEEYCNFSKTKPIISERCLSDLNNNLYKLYELENGYAIYFVGENNETFLEGSYETNSPFFGYENNDVFYQGPGKYYVKESGQMLDILNVPIDEFRERREKTIETYGAVHEDWGDIVDEEDNLDGYTLIDDYQYFKGLEIFPTNYLGTCGVVAICILLGYYDTFYNDNFVDNNMSYEARTYKSVSENQKEDIILSTEENVPFLETVELDYNSKCINNGEYPLSEWNSYPGTTQALHDYIFDNYIEYNSTAKNLAWGYPMLPYDVHKTLENYIKNECSTLQNDINLKYGSYLTASAVKTTIRKQIDNNIPLAVTLVSYSVEGEEDTDDIPHTAVAYGYDSAEENFVVQMGLPEYLGGATILNSSFIYGYCYLNYSGNHVHSKNAKCEESSRLVYKKNTYEICGCGYTNKISDSILQPIRNEGGD